MDDFKSKIREIEAEIFTITGKNNEIYNHWADDNEKRNKVRSLLARRCDFINDVVFGNPAPGAEDESRRLEDVNKHLLQLTSRAYSRIGEIEDTISNLAHSADEDYHMVSRVRFIYDGEDSVLKLENDCFYGSNFTLIIKVIYELSVAEGNAIIVSTDDYDEIDDDKVSIYPFWRCKECFMGVMICRAMEYLAHNNYYSAADLCRLNNFVSDVTIVMSQNTDQKGHFQ